MQLVTDCLENSSRQMASKLCMGGGVTPPGHAHTRSRLLPLSGVEKGSGTNRASQAVTKSVFIGVVLTGWEPTLSAILFARLELA